MASSRHACICSVVAINRQQQLCHIASPSLPLHYSKANWSETPRPLLLNVYSAANAMPYTANPIPSKYTGAIVRGKPARWAYHDPRHCMLPPDWSGGYTSIFAVQQAEDWAKNRPKAAGGGMM